jgi:hypothetical protein
MIGFIAGPAYAKKDKSGQLPPGLQKKVDRGEPLPPGWQKKIAKGDILDKNIFRHGKIVVPVDPYGIITVRIDGKLLKLNKNTRKIIDILN